MPAQLSGTPLCPADVDLVSAHVGDFRRFPEWVGNELMVFESTSGFQNRQTWSFGPEPDHTVRFVAELGPAR